MKRRILSIISVLMVTCFMSACTTTQEENPASKTESTISQETSSVTSSENVKSKEDESDRELSIKVKGDTYPLTVVDYLKDETVIETAPERVAVLSGSQMNIWYDLGGKSICTSKISKNLKILSGYEDEFHNLPSVGAVYRVNMESIIAMKPDLIITQAGIQTTVAKELRDMGFDVISVKQKSYDDVIDIYKAFGKILQNEKLAEEKIASIEKEKSDLMSKTPDESKSVVILYLTSKSVSVKLDNSIAGDVCKTLGIKNIASNLPADKIGSESTPLDIEYIVEQNPDYVLVTSMISNNDVAVETMEKQFAENPAWKGVKAVQEGRVSYLPQQYFLHNAGPYYCTAIDYVGRSVYPDIYGKVQDWDGK